MKDVRLWGVVNDDYTFQIPPKLAQILFRKTKSECKVMEYIKGSMQGRGMLIFEVALFELLVWPHKVEPWFHSCRIETLDAKYNLIFR